MKPWEKGPTLAIGGVVAVAFVDEATLAVGSHSGLGIMDVFTGAVQERLPDVDGTYAWYQADPPAVRRRTTAGIELLPAAGLWGGELPRGTGDGWSAELTSLGATLRHADHEEIVIADDEEPRALGFSPKAKVLVFATAPTVHLYLR